MALCSRDCGYCPFERKAALGEWQYCRSNNSYLIMTLRGRVEVDNLQDLSEQLREVHSTEAYWVSALTKEEHNV